MLEPRPGTHSLDEITEEAAAILNLVPNLSGLVGVEVGTLRGKTASILLLRRPGLRLICVDPFEVEEFVEDSPDAVWGAWERNTATWEDRCQLVHMRSVEAAAAPLSIYDCRDAADFVYLDAMHDYENVAADIAAWWPHVRSGGLLMGHDYGRTGPASAPGKGWGVAPAVHEFLEREGLALHHLERTTWAVKKP